MACLSLLKQCCLIWLMHFPPEAQSFIYLTPQLCIIQSATESLAQEAFSFEVAAWGWHCRLRQLGGEGNDVTLAGFLELFPILSPLVEKILGNGESDSKLRKLSLQTLSVEGASASKSDSAADVAPLASAKIELSEVESSRLQSESALKTCQGRGRVGSGISVCCLLLCFWLEFRKKPLRKGRPDCRLLFATISSKSLPALQIRVFRNAERAVVLCHGEQGQAVLVI